MASTASAHLAMMWDSAAQAAARTPAGCSAGSMPARPAPQAAQFRIKVLPLHSRTVSPTSSAAWRLSASCVST